MHLLENVDKNELAGIGHELHSLAAELYSICRSITGEGIRHTLARIQKCIPLQTFDVPTGAEVLLMLTSRGLSTSRPVTCMWSATARRFMQLCP